MADLGVELAFMADKLRARDAEALGAQQELDVVLARLAKAGVDYVRARLCKNPRGDEGRALGPLVAKCNRGGVHPMQRR